MKDVLYVPGLKKNLLSISYLDKKAFRVAFIDGQVLMWKKCNTPVLTPFALNIHDTYIVNNNAAELKKRAPPWI